MVALTRKARAAQPSRSLAILGRLAPLGAALAASLCTAAAAETAGHNRCAAYGSDYAAVSGGEGCVRLGGHVRADNTVHAAVAPSLLAVPAGFARAIADGVNNVSQSISAQPQPGAHLYRR